MLYTREAALQILWPLAIEILKNPRELKNAIQVTYRVWNGGTCSTFLSKKAFASYRQEELNLRVVANKYNDEFTIYHHGNLAATVSLNLDLDWSSRQEKWEVEILGEGKLNFQFNNREAAFDYLNLKFRFRVSLSDRQKAKLIWELSGGSFGYMPTSFHPNFEPTDIYYPRDRVQIWKFASKDWGTTGHFWIVDTQLQAVVYVYQHSWGACWQATRDKRFEYIGLLNDFDRLLSRREYVAR